MSADEHADVVLRLDHADDHRATLAAAPSMILSTGSCRRFLAPSERPITTSFVIGAAQQRGLEAAHWDSSTTSEFSPLAIVVS
jgi:hypothetical protein